MENKTDKLRTLVVEFETEEEHKEYHKNGTQKTCTFHIHAGEGFKFGGMGVVLDARTVDEAHSISNETDKAK